MIIGVTGSVGCGKSFAMSYLGELGFNTISADEICREFYSSKDAVVLHERWGKDIFFSEKGINFSKIGEIIFENKEEMDFLSNHIYGYVDKKIAFFIEECKRNNVTGFVEIPLLFEKNYQKKIDKTLAIWCSKKERHRRLKENRKMSEIEISQREKKQFSAEKKIELADYVVTNNGSICDLKIQLDIFIERIN